MTTATLTDRQRDLVGLIDCGADSEEIASELGLSQWTVRDQIKRLRGKLGAASMRDLPAAARAAGVDLPVCDDVE